MTSIVTSLVLEEFWLDCEVGGKTITQTRMEKRIIECSLSLNQEKTQRDEQYILIITINIFCFYDFSLKGN